MLELAGSIQIYAWVCMRPHLFVTHLFVHAVTRLCKCMYTACANVNHYAQWLLCIAKYSACTPEYLWKWNSCGVCVCINCACLPCAWFWVQSPVSHKQNVMIHTPVITTFSEWKHGDQSFKIILGYIEFKTTLGFVKCYLKIKIK